MHNVIVKSSCILSLTTLTEDEIFHGPYQQDSPTAYTARVSTELLHNVFGNRLISNRKLISIAYGHHVRQIARPRLLSVERAMKNSVYKDEGSHHKAYPQGFSIVYILQ